MASWFMCEACGDQFFNLNALGFCLDIEENMMDVLLEYREMVAEERSRKAEGKLVAGGDCKILGRKEDCKWEKS